jgi:hypothetical protein
MKFKSPALVFFLLFLINYLQAQDSRDISYMSWGGQLKTLQAIMDIRHYTIALDVNMEEQSIDGYAEIDLLLTQPTDTILFDLVHFLKVKKISVNKKNSSFSQQGDSIFIVSSKGFSAGKQK